MINDLEVGRDNSQCKERSGQSVGGAGAELAPTGAGLRSVRAAERRQDRHKARDNNRGRQAKVGVMSVERAVHQNF